MQIASANKQNAQTTERTPLVLPETLLSVQPVVKAAVLLAARSLSYDLGLQDGCSVAEILNATGSSRSRAYEVCATLTQSLGTLVRPRGRPPTEASPQPPDQTGEAVTMAVLAFVLGHPGCAQGGSVRQRYSEQFCHFILQLRSQHPTLSLEDFAYRAQVPLGTLKSWLAHRPLGIEPNQAGHRSGADESKSEGPFDRRSQEVTLAEVEAVLTEWKTWKGTFAGFVAHVRTHLRLPMGRQLIAKILEACGKRCPRRRQGRSPDELALRGAFETFFPGAQWVGDGKSVDVFVNGDKHTVNLELNVDAHTSAWVGVSVRDEEDSTAVTEAFSDGIATTGAAPLAELLDNKPCNHTSVVEETLSDTNTLLMRSTKQRPQNKAHVEGAFGLFSQTAPPIELNTNSSNQSIARALVLMVATTFARAINRRPRIDRAGRTRIELYMDEPTEERIEEAKRALQERWERQERARATKEARQQPHIRELLDEHFDRLGLLDPKRYIRLTIASYPLDAIVDGIAIFTAKKQANTLPEGAAGRYLLGIVRNIAAQREGERVAQTLWEHRTSARDRAIELLQHSREEITRQERPADDVIYDCTVAAMDAERNIDRLFWLTAIADYTKSRPIHTHRHMYSLAARYINTTFRVPPKQRQEAIRFLADHMITMN